MSFSSSLLEARIISLQPSLTLPCYLPLARPILQKKKEKDLGENTKVKSHQQKSYDKKLKRQKTIDKNLMSNKNKIKRKVPTTACFVSMQCCKICKKAGKHAEFNL